MIHISKNTYNEISNEIISSLIKGQSIDEIYANGLAFVMGESHREDNEISRTGVAYMGEEETFLQPYICDVALTFFGAYDEDGNEVRTDFDVRHINIKSRIEC